MFVLSHSVWSAMKYWAKVISSAWKGIICQNIQRVLKKIPINRKQQKYIETQELKLKQQRISLKCLITENFSLTIKQLTLL